MIEFVPYFLLALFVLLFAQANYLLRQSLAREKRLQQSVTDALATCQKWQSVANTWEKTAKGFEVEFHRMEQAYNSMREANERNHRTAVEAMAMLKTSPVPFDGKPPWANG